MTTAAHLLCEAAYKGYNAIRPFMFFSSSGIFCPDPVFSGAKKWFMGLTSCWCRYVHLGGGFQLFFSVFFTPKKLGKKLSWSSYK